MIIHLISPSLTSSITSFHFSLTNLKHFFVSNIPPIKIKPKIIHIKILLLFILSQKIFKLSLLDFSECNNSIIEVNPIVKIITRGAKRPQTHKY